MLNANEPFVGWPSGKSLEIMYVNLTKEEIEERYELTNWIEGIDGGLNIVIHGAHFLDEQLGPVAFNCYDHPKDLNVPAKTEILIDSSLDLEWAIKRLKEVLSLTEDEIVFLATEAEFIPSRTES